MTLKHFPLLAVFFLTFTLSGCFGSGAHTSVAGYTNGLPGSPSASTDNTMPSGTIQQSSSDSYEAVVRSAPLAINKVSTSENYSMTDYVLEMHIDRSDELN